MRSKEGISPVTLSQPFPSTRRLLPDAMSIAEPKSAPVGGASYGLQIDFNWGGKGPMKDLVAQANQAAKRAGI